MPEVNAPGMLAIWHDLAPGHEAAVRDWYAREHHFERLDIPGFVEMHRFDRVQGEGGAMLCLYRSSSPEVFASAAYKARLAQLTPGTQAAMPHFRNMSRTVCSLTAQAGRAEGGFVGVVSIAGGAARTGTERVAAGFQAVLAAMPLLRLRCIVAVPQPAAPGETAESRLRGAPDGRIDAAVLIDAESASSAQRAVDDISAELATDLPPGSRLQRAVYQLAFAARSNP